MTAGMLGLNLRITNLIEPSRSFENVLEHSGSFEYLPSRDTSRVITWRKSRDYLLSTRGHVITRSHDQGLFLVSIVVMEPWRSGQTYL
jgi:hypothetical protein